MKRHAPLFALLVVLGALVIGLGVLFQRRVAQGDSFPAYSSLRSDPLGTRALHDSLAQVPGLRVERQFRLLSEVTPAPPRALVLAGIAPNLWTRTLREDFDALDAVVREGGRLVLAFRAAAARTPKEIEEARRAETETERKHRELADEHDEAQPRKVVYMDLRRRWGAELKERVLMERTAVGAVRTADEAAAPLPATIAWKSDVYFELEPDAGWRVLYRRGGEPVLVERSHGRGSIVLVADSYILSNEALQNVRAAGLLAWLIGPQRLIVFDEAHLGVVAQPGVAALARRYGLSGAFFTLLLLAALFVWRRMALFVPPVQSEGEVALTYHPAAGLEALLQRAVPPGDLAATCVAEWRPTARESELKRAEAASASVPAKASPADRYNAIVRALRRR